MFKPFAALLLSGVLAVTSFAPTTARAADADDVARFIVGALVLYGLADAIDNRSSSKQRIVVAPKQQTKKVVVPHKKPQKKVVKKKQVHRPHAQHHFAGRRHLPSGCFLTHRQHYHETRTVFGNQCLRTHYRHYASLPKHCYVRFHTVKGTRVGWGPRCLRRAGYSW